MIYTLPHVYEVRARAEVHTLAAEGKVNPGVVIGLRRESNAALPVGYRRIVIDLAAVIGLGAQTSLMLAGALRRTVKPASDGRDCRVPAAGAARARTL